MSQKQKILTKTTKFGSSTVTLYSLDGATWSSRKDELPIIMERHEAQKVTAAQLRGEAPEAGSVPPAGAKPTALPRIPSKGRSIEEPPEVLEEEPQKSEVKASEVKPTEAKAKVTSKVTKSKKASTTPKARTATTTSQKKSVGKRKAA